MRKCLALLAGAFAVTLGTGVVAQSPPPWLGGRVEMPEHGFAVTLPDDWVGFDTTVDAVSQLEVAFDPALWSADEAAWADHFAWLASDGRVLWIVDVTTNDICELGPSPLDWSLTEVADSHYEWYSENPSARDVELQGPIDLPAGPAYRIWLTQQDPDSDAWGPASHYVIEADGALLEAYCFNYGAGPEDDWLSIVQTIEPLPAPGPPPPWLGGRVEMPEHGFAISLPDDWVGFDTAGDAVSQLEAASDALDPVWFDDDAEVRDALISTAPEDAPLWFAPTTGVGHCAIGTQYGTGVRAEDYADIMFGLFRRGPDTREVELPQRVDLPAGTAYLLRMLERDEPGEDTWSPFSAYLLSTDDVLLVMTCSLSDSHPANDWRAIAETIEFLPPEE